MLTLRPSTAAVASPTESIDPDATEEPTPPPVADTHDAPELEALLPLTLGETPLQVQSWTGETHLSDDPWSTSMTTFLTNAGKTPKDLRVALATDPAQTLDGNVWLYHVDGVKGSAVQDALIAAWKVDYPEMTVSTLTLDGKTITKCDFGEQAEADYFYMRDDYVFDIETSDEAIAIAALAALPAPGASPSGAPRSPAPSGSPVTSPSPS